MQSHSISDPGDRGGRLRLAEEEDLLSSPTPEPGPQPKGLGPLATQIEGNKLPRNGPTIALELLRLGPLGTRLQTEFQGNVHRQGLRNPLTIDGERLLADSSPQAASEGLGPLA